jgi:RNA polymerase sigma-70 factor (ECF subfamily)
MGTTDREADFALVDRAVAGDSAAFADLFERHRHAVFKVSFGVTRDREEALDVVQDAFLKAYRSLEGFQKKSSVLTWLCQIAVHRAIDKRRRKKAPAISIEEYMAAPTVSGGPGTGSGRDLSPAWGVGGARPRNAPSPVADVQARELAERLRDALAQLSEKHRTVFVLYTTKGLSYKEIADALGISVGTVMSRLFYARKNLQGLLAEFVKEA